MAQAPRIVDCSIRNTEQDKNRTRQARKMETDQGCCLIQQRLPENPASHFNHYCWGTTRSVCPRPENVHLEGIVYWGIHLARWFNARYRTSRKGTLPFREIGTQVRKSWKTTQAKASEPIPMDIVNLQLKMLTAAERDQCRKERNYLRCSEKEHMAKKCPKG